MQNIIVYHIVVRSDWFFCALLLFPINFLILELFQPLMRYFPKQMIQNHGYSYSQMTFFDSTTNIIYSTFPAHLLNYWVEMSKHCNKFVRHGCSCVHIFKLQFPCVVLSHTIETIFLCFNKN